VFGSIVAGYLLEDGNLAVLFQPAEFIIIGGAAIGTLLVANPPHLLKEIFRGVLSTLTGSGYTKEFFKENLRMLYELFTHARKEGVASIEPEVDNPNNSQIFSKYPRFLKKPHAVRFLCDTLRTHISGGISHMELDHLMELEMEVHHEETHKPIHALATVADSLPGLGIVAAVLGVVITMASLGGPPEEIGHKVAAALVGTFLGVLLCYGLVGPVAGNMAKNGESDLQYLRCLRAGILSYVKGAAPILAVEFARRSIPEHNRPTFEETEAFCRSEEAA
jgi:chemotaxis protein MotA